MAHNTNRIHRSSAFRHRLERLVSSSRRVIATLKWACIPTSAILMPDGFLSVPMEDFLVRRLHFRYFTCQQCGRQGIAFPHERNICQMRKCFLKDKGIA